MVSDRAAILPFPGDPFLLHYWLQIFDKYWGNEVGMLYVHLNSHIQLDVVNYIMELCAQRPNVTCIYTPKQIEHGEAIRVVLEQIKEEFVMLVEDDAFIFRHGWVNHCFEIIECNEADIVGSKRGSCSQMILAQAKSKWGLAYEGMGDQGCNFWPNFFFCRRELLLNTDRNFCAKTWVAGETIPGIDVVVDGEIAVGDTFVNTSLQLRAVVPERRITYVDQYHASPDDVDHLAAGKYLFDGVAPWTHIGSLSSGVGGLLKDNDNRSLSYINIKEPNGPTVLDNGPTNEMERKEYERRVAWWLRFVEDREEGKIDEFATLYFAAVQRIVNDFKLNIHNIRHLQKAYRSLGL